MTTISEKDARDYILKKIAVTRQRVTIAKAYVLKYFDSSTDRHSRALIDRFLKSMNIHMPEKVVSHETVDPLPVLDAAAEAISWKLAMYEAIWKLIGSATILPDSSEMTYEPEPSSMGYTTVTARSGGYSGGFSLAEIRVGVPQQIIRARSYDPTIDQPLTDPDLYLKEINLGGLHPDIETALREAVRCFRYDLYLPCLAMLGRASEVAWIELGLALARASKDVPSFKSEKLREDMESPFPGFAKKINLVTEAYNRKDVFEQITKQSGITPQDLRNCVVWADCVRESRNSLHYGAEPSMSNTYEKVAALLIGAVPHIKTITTIVKVVNSSKSFLI